jgi:hypothetical protein
MAWVVMRMSRWEEIEISTNVPLPFPVSRSKEPADPDQPVGFLPIFETYEAAERWAENGRFQIREVSMGELPGKEQE